MKFGSLFSGIGGFDLGLERAGMECAWQVEIDEYCLKVLEKHWPSVSRYTDVRECGRDNLEPVDLICGGFPCIDISRAGKKEGINGKDSGLWTEFFRIIGELRPQYAVVENVSDLLSWEINKPHVTITELNKRLPAPHTLSRYDIVGAVANQRALDLDFRSIRRHICASCIPAHFFFISFGAAS